MRVSRRGAGLLALAALLLPAGTEARAQELLVMPYTCTMVGGQPLLSPGPEQSHRIVGKRRQRKFSACSPVNPDMCRSWTVHRFDLDCDGARVSWISVMAATNEGSRRAWLLDGRLLLRMGPRWSLAPDDPCARPLDADEPPAFGRRMRRRCADRLAMAPPPVVEMPFGYAPVLGIDAIFVTADPRVADDAPLPPIVAGPAPTKSAAGGAKQQIVRPMQPERTPAANGSQPKSSPSAAQPPPAPKVASTATPPASDRIPPTPAEPATAAPKSVSPPTAAPQAALQKAAPQSPPPPKAIRPAAPPVSQVEKAPRADSAAAAVEKRASRTAAASPPPPPPKPALRPAAPSRPDAEPESAFSPSLLSVFRTTTTGAIVAFAGLALGLLAAFALARRREHARDAGARRRHVAAPSLDGKRTKASARAVDIRGRAAPNPAPNSAPAATGGQAGRSMATGGVADWGDRMPRTRDEALEVLGIGIAPSATETAIKKIVDGLRMSWHPDLAKDETDRTLRELRSKQINAAWDLLQGQRTQGQRAEV